MFLNAIRIHTEGAGQPEVWKLSSSSGAMEHVVSLLQKSDDDLRMLRGLKYVLCGATDGSIQSAALHLSDSAGHTWVIERESENIRGLRDGEEIAQESLPNQLLSALTDDAVALFKSDPDGNANDVELFELISSFETKLVNEKLYLSRASSKEIFAQRNNSALEVRRSELLQECSDVIGKGISLDEGTLSTINRKLKPLFLKINEMRSQKRDSKFEGSDIDLKLLHQLEEQVEHLTKIKQVAEPLVDPGATPPLLKEKLKQIDDQLKELRSHADLEKIAVNDEGVPWQKLLEARSVLDALDRSIRATANCKSNQQERVDEILSEYMSTVDKMIRNDVQITAELESCLSSLAIKARQEETQEEKEESRKFSQLLTKFIKPDAESGETKLEIRASQRLEEFRNAVDFALARLGELHTDLASVKSDFESSRSKSEEQFESLVTRFGKARERWLHLAERYAVRADIELSELMDLNAKAYGMLGMIQTRKTLAKKLTQRNLKLAELEQLVLEWRQITGSHKSSPLANERILLSEASSLLSYHQKKTAQLAKMRTLAEKLRANHIQQSMVESRLQQHLKKWHDQASELGLAGLSPKEQWWWSIFEKAERLSALRELTELANKPSALHEGLRQAQTEAPIKLIFVDREVQSKEALAELSSTVESSANEGLNILIHKDSELHTKLTKKGAGAAKSIGKSRAKRQSKSKSGAKIVAPELNERAKRALEVLAVRSNRQNSPSRSL